jgi:hypothetical protein
VTLCCISLDIKRVTSSDTVLYFTGHQESYFQWHCVVFHWTSWELLPVTLCCISLDIKRVTSSDTVLYFTGHQESYFQWHSLPVLRPVFHFFFNFYTGLPCGCVSYVISTAAKARHGLIFATKFFASVLMLYSCIVIKVLLVKCNRFTHCFPICCRDRLDINVTETLFYFDCWLWWTCSVITSSLLSRDSPGRQLK